MAVDRIEPGVRARPAPGPEGGAATGNDAPPVDEDGRKAPAPRIAQRILLFVLCSYVLTGVINIRIDNPGDNLANIGSYVCMFIVFLLQVAHTTRRAPDWPLKIRILTLSAQTLATYLPFVVYHELWGGMAGFLGGSFIILLRRPVSWILFALCPLSIAVMSIATGQTAPWVVYFGVATANLGLFVYAVTRLTDLVTALHAARTELARMAVAQERLRFARDLHDLLGYSLSSITLKSELAYRLADGQPERARLELSSILQISRQALSDVRVVASSYRDMHFAEEVASVESMLLATDVDVSVEVSLPDLPRSLDTVLATVLREGVTNVLRHSKVQHCSIIGRVADGTVRLELVNDGITAEPADGPDTAGSSGLGSLGLRLASVGGRLTAGVCPDGLFRLVAEAPLGGSGAAADPARPQVKLAGGLWRGTNSP